MEETGAHPQQPQALASAVAGSEAPSGPAPHPKPKRLARRRRVFATSLEVEEDRAVPLPNAPVTVIVPEYGEITWYPSGVFIAACRRQGHGDCWRKRPALKTTRAGSGRVCGHQMAWLKDPRGVDNASHEKIKGTQLVLEKREAERAELKLLDNGKALLNCERRQFRGPPREAEEPPRVT